jgi:hypothetical protein
LRYARTGVKVNRTWNASTSVAPNTLRNYTVILNRGLRNTIRRLIGLIETITH